MLIWPIYIIEWPVLLGWEAALILATTLHFLMTFILGVLMTIHNLMHFRYIKK